jgi:hypothetical protein
MRTFTYMVLNSGIRYKLIYHRIKSPDGVTGESWPVYLLTLKSNPRTRLDRIQNRFWEGLGYFDNLMKLNPCCVRIVTCDLIVI